MADMIEGASGDEASYIKHLIEEMQSKLGGSNGGAQGALSYQEQVGFKMQSTDFDINEEFQNAMDHISQTEQHIGQLIQMSQFMLQRNDELSTLSQQYADQNQQAKLDAMDAQAKLQQLVEEGAFHKSKNEQYESHCKSLESENQTQRIDLQESREQIRELQDVQRQFNDLKLQQDDILFKKDQQYELLKKDLQSKIPSLESELKELQVELSGERKKRMKYEGEFNKLCLEFEDLKKAEKKAQTKLGKSERAAQMMRAEIKDLKLELDEVKEDYERYKATAMQSQGNQNNQQNAMGNNEIDQYEHSDASSVDNHQQQNVNDTSIGQLSNKDWDDQNNISQQIEDGPSGEAFPQQFGEQNNDELEFLDQNNTQDNVQLEMIDADQPQIVDDTFVARNSNVSDSAVQFAQQFQQARQDDYFEKRSSSASFANQQLDDQGSRRGSLFLNPTGSQHQQQRRMSKYAPRPVQTCDSETQTEDAKPLTQYSECETQTEVLEQVSQGQQTIQVFQMESGSQTALAQVESEGCQTLSVETCNAEVQAAALSIMINDDESEEHQQSEATISEQQEGFSQTQNTDASSTMQQTSTYQPAPPQIKKTAALTAKANAKQGSLFADEDDDQEGDLNAAGLTNRERIDLQYLKQRDPMKEFFSLTLKSIKINQQHFSFIHMIDEDGLYKKANTTGIPFFQWNTWISTQLQREVFQQLIKTQKFQEEKRKKVEQEEVQKKKKSVGFMGMLANQLFNDQFQKEEEQKTQATPIKKSALKNTNKPSNTKTVASSGMPSFAPKTPKGGQDAKVTKKTASGVPTFF